MPPLIHADLELMTADIFMANTSATKQDLIKIEEGLARMIGKGFDGVDKRFEQVDKRFEQVDKRFEQVDQRFEQVGKRFDRVEQRLERIEMKLENVVYRTEFEELKERLMVVEDALAINPKKK